MKPTTNPITGDKLITKPSNDRYRSNYEAIFSKDFCVVCGGHCLIYTGIDESPATNCTHCDGTGYEPKKEKK